MDRRIFGWDLPPGCRVSDIPGNRPEDEAWEGIYEGFWDKERLTKTAKGVRITEEEYAKMDKLYNSKLSEVIDDYIMAAIEYGMEIATKQAQDNAQENLYYETQFIERTIVESKTPEEALAKIKKMHGIKED